MAETGLNTDLMVRIADAVEANPELYAQNDWGDARRSPLGLVAMKRAAFDAGATCRTPACIAGWAVILNGGRIRNAPSEILEAEKVLGITKAQGDELFTRSWFGHWFIRAGISKPAGNERYRPTAAETAIILRAMAADGTIWPA